MRQSVGKPRGYRGEWSPKALCDGTIKFDWDREQKLWDRDQGQDQKYVGTGTKDRDQFWSGTGTKTMTKNETMICNKKNKHTN